MKTSGEAETTEAVSTTHKYIQDVRIIFTLCKNVTMLPEMFRLYC